MAISIVCHIALVRAMLVSVCESAGFTIAASCERVEDLTGVGDQDVVLLQVFQEGRDVAQAVAHIRALSNSAAIALIAPDRSVERLQLEIGNRVAAIIPESVSVDVFTSSVKMVESGYRLMPNTALAAARPSAHPGGGDPHETPSRGMIDLLSKREIAILARLSNGLPNKTIAKELGISEGTVKVHLRTIFRKTGVHNRTQAALWGTSHL